MALSKSVEEQQGVIKTALNRIYPNMEMGSSEGEFCPEHVAWFEEYVQRISKKKKKEKAAVAAVTVTAADEEKST